MDSISLAIIFLQSHSAHILGFLFAVSELLAYIPSVKGNGIFQVIHELLKERMQSKVKEDV